MNIKTASAFLLGVAVIGMAGLVVWFVSRDAPSVSAQEVVERACAGMADVDSYDFIVTVKAEQGGVPFPETLTIKASISGKDYQTSITADDDGNQSASEGIKVGDMSYERTTGNPWRISEAPFQDIVSHLGQLGDSPVCPDLNNVTWKGEEELDGVKVTLYTSGDTSGVEKDALDDVDSSFQGLKHVSVHEYWVDSNGLLVQHREDRYTLSKHDGGSTLLRFLTLARFLDVGEPNIITAPVVGSP